MKTKMIRLIYIFIIINSIFIYSESSKKLSVKKANTLLKNYAKVFSSTNEMQLKEYWSKEYTDDDFFRALPLYIDKSVSINNCTFCFKEIKISYKYIKISKENDYYKLVAEYRTDEIRKNNGKKIMIFYVVFEKGKWLFADPSKLLTRNWKILETEFFIFKYPGKLNILNYSNQIAYMNSKCRKLLKIFNVKLPKKIKYYKTISAKQAGELITSSPANGWCVRSEHPEKTPWFNIITSSSFANSHELVHAITALKGIPDINVFFLEGIAVALEGTTWLTNKYSFIEAGKIIKNNKNIDIRKFFKLDEFLKNTKISYHVAGAFVNYLLEIYGMEKYLLFCSTFKYEANISKLCKKIYGYDLDKIISKWKLYIIKKSESYEIGYDIPITARQIFEMNDIIGDDYGPGSYYYPKFNKFEKGICDIKKVSIYNDKKRIYFKISMKNIIKPVHNPRNKENITSAIHICIKTDLHNKYLESSFGGIQFYPKKGYSYRISAGFGVSITDSNNKKQLITENSFSQMMDLKNNIITFSIPINLIGKPSLKWEIAVFSGLQNDYAADITYGRLEDIKEKGGLFVSGGGSDSRFNPRFFDILLPRNLDKKNILNSFNVSNKSFAIIPMIKLIDYSSIFQK